MTADPKVRAITVDPNDGTAGSANGGIGGAGSTAPYALGSASRVRAAEERKAGYRPEVTYPGGWGNELIATENGIIDSELAKNEPEWDGSQWINAVGSPAESTSYATVETADGLAPLAGGSSGAVALGVGVGGAALGAGVAKMVANKNATAGAARTGAAPATARTTSTTGRAGAGAGGQRSAGRSMTGSGSRAGMRGSGAGGAGGRTGSMKDNKARSKDQEFLDQVHSGGMSRFSTVETGASRRAAIAVVPTPLAWVHAAASSHDSHPAAPRRRIPRTSTACVRASPIDGKYSNGSPSLQPATRPIPDRSRRQSGNS